MSLTPLATVLSNPVLKPSALGKALEQLWGSFMVVCGGTVSTHVHSEVLEALELAEVFLQFAVDVQIFGFGIF